MEQVLVQQTKKGKGVFANRPETYLGPSESPDNFVNHSCEPNAAVKILGTHASLIAIEKIPKGEEISYDYSLTMVNDDWTMDCHCGAVQCRKEIMEFPCLPSAVQKKYIARGIVPDYVLSTLNFSLNKV